MSTDLDRSDGLGETHRVGRVARRHAPDHLVVEHRDALVDPVGAREAHLGEHLVASTDRPVGREGDFDRETQHLVDGSGGAVEDEIARGRPDEVGAVVDRLHQLDGAHVHRVDQERHPEEAFTREEADALMAVRSGVAAGEAVELELDAIAHEAFLHVHREARLRLALIHEAVDVALSVGVGDVADRADGRSHVVVAELVLVVRVAHPAAGAAPVEALAHHRGGAVNDRAQLPPQGRGAEHDVGRAAIRERSDVRLVALLFGPLVAVVVEHGRIRLPFGDPVVGKVVVTIDEPGADHALGANDRRVVVRAARVDAGDEPILDSHFAHERTAGREDDPRQHQVGAPRLDGCGR